MNPARNRDRLIVLISVFVFLAVFVVLWLRTNNAAAAPYRIPPASVSTMKPQRENLRKSLTFPAILGAERTISVVPRVPGTILEILVEEGQEVSKGDLLARIDSEPYELEYQAAESAWLLAESSLARTERLYQSSGASLQNLEEARAGRDAALSSYKLAGIRRGYAEVRAPITGMILVRYADTGAMASSEYPLFSVGDDSSPQVRVRIPEKHWDSFQNPGPQRVIVRRPGDEYKQSPEAEILRISPGISPVDKTFEVTCALKPEEVSWPLGARLTVEFILSERNDAWSLPIRALAGDGGLWWVDGTDPVARRIDGRDFYTDGARVAVPEELSERIYILDGHHRIQEGQAVRPVGLDS